MGLDMYLEAEAEIKSIKWASPIETMKESEFDREVIITFPNNKEKKIKAWYISRITFSFYGDAKEVSVHEIVNITDGTPVFVRGNVSDIMANIQLIITDDNGYQMEYLPSMSLENGLLSKGQQIYDFSPYQLIGGHFENINSEDAPAFVGTWWGVYTEADGNDLSLNLSLKENGEAEYSYGYGNSEIFEQFSGSWYKDGEDKINLIMYGGPCSSDGAEAETGALYEFDGTFSWYYNEDNGELELTHESGSILLYGTEGQNFAFESLV